MPAQTDADRNPTGEPLEDGTVFTSGLPRVTKHLPETGGEMGQALPASRRSLPTHGHAARHSASVPTRRAPALNKAGHSARTAQRFHATDEHPPLLPALQPREIRCKSPLFPSTDPHFFSPRSLTNALCAPHLISVCHLLVR